MTTPSPKPEPTIQRIGGMLHRVVPIVDNAGKVMHVAVRPLMVELSSGDMMQIIVGASILGIPLAFTEESWRLGETLPLANVIALTGLSLLFISVFVYLNFYRVAFKGYRVEYIKRVLAIYVLSLLVVGVLLTIIQKCPWGVDNVLAIKRILIVGFPASMSAAISDMTK